MKLRGKLLLLSLSLLALPWVGYRYVGEMETFLRQGQDQALLARAHALAAVFGDRANLLRRHSQLLAGVPDKRIYVVRALDAPVQLDGYPDEWRPYLDLARRFDHGPGFRVEHLLATRGGDLYALFLVTDDHVVYRDPARGTEGDHLVVALAGPDGRLHRYIMSTSAPGRLNAYTLGPHGRGRWEPAISGEWQEMPGGYSVELRIRASLAPRRLSFVIYDVNTPGGPVVDKISTGGTDSVADLGVLLWPDAQIAHLLAGMSTPGIRTWVVDTGGRVLGVAGGLATSQPQKRRDLPTALADLVYRLFLPQPMLDFADPQAHAARLGGAEIRTALAGKPATRRRATADGGAVIASAAYPIRTADGVDGAVLVEQTTNAILSVKNQAMKNLINISLAVFAAVLITLLTFATRLSLRVRRLRDEAEAAIGPDGRVRGGVSPSRAGDELGDLNRSFAALLGRLGQYTRYLETIAGKLSHELRTPITVVKSSLENLQGAVPEAAAEPSLARAQEGIARLDTLLTRMSEASRLEQALQEADSERLDLGKLVGACTEGYRLAYPEHRFELSGIGVPLPLVGAPDLLAQMLDKLVGNAVDFAPAGSAVHINLARHGDEVRLEVANEGPPLPEAPEGQLFDSMVSLRRRRGGEPHLGLGLYIVRLVAQFHRGRVEAHNLPTGDGVVFAVTLPLAG